MSTFILEVGISTFSCSALLALRMRVSMSAIGSVSIVPRLPARLRHARDRALMRELAQANPTEPELLEHRARPAAPVAPRVRAHLVLLGPLLLDDERCLRHCLVPPLALGAERQAHGLEQRAGVVVGLGGSRDRHVEPADLLDVVVVDLWKDDLLPHAHRVVAAAVERLRVQPAEVADARQRDRDEPVEELVHPGAAERHLRADRHAFADLELRDRLPGAANLRALPGDDRQLFDRGVELLGVVLRLADAHVERDLRDARHLHDRLHAELVLQARTELVVVAVLETRCIGLGCRHYRSISWPQSACLHTRTRIVLSFVVRRCVPTRVGRLQVGHTTITLETGSGEACSIRPPGMICGPPMRLEFWIGRGRRCRTIMLRFSTRTRLSFGLASRTRPCLPRSLPFMTCTVSPLRTFSVCATTTRPPVRVRRF